MENEECEAEAHIRALIERWANAAQRQDTEALAADHATKLPMFDGELWHATWEGDKRVLRPVDPRTGEVLERVAMAPGGMVSGLESDGGDLFFCGGGRSGKVRAVRRPKRGSAREG